MADRATTTKKAKLALAKPRLGRGLSSLIVNSAQPPAPALESPEPASQPQVADNDGLGAYVSAASPPPAEPKASVAISANDGGGISEIATAVIVANPYQPRREFNDDELKDLARSIAQQGILQPLIVCPSAAEAGQFVLIAGERRLRAARLAGLAKVPCVIRTATQQQMLEWAIIENIQRADLNPVEKARAYRDYMDRFQLSVAAVGEKLSQPRTTVANYLRILDLPDDVQNLLLDGSMSFGHAKILAGLAGAPKRQLELARRVVGETLSVRQLEQLAEMPAETSPDLSASPGRPIRQKAAYLRDLEDQFTQKIGTHVSIMPGRAKHSGKMIIEYYSLDDFDKICSMMGVEIQG
jgi:ParB family chromosome partitioning protein